MSVTKEVGDFISSELLVGRGSGAPAPDEDLLVRIEEYVQSRRNSAP